MSNKHPVGLVLLRTEKASYIKNNALQSLSNLYHKLLEAPCLRKAIKKSETKKILIFKSPDCGVNPDGQN